MAYCSVEEVVTKQASWMVVWMKERGTGRKSSDSEQKRRGSL